MNNHELKAEADKAKNPKLLTRADALRHLQRANKQVSADDIAIELAIYHAPGAITPEEMDARQAQRLADLLEQATGGAA
jgi:hypothetical protein